MNTRERIYESIVRLLVQETGRPPTLREIAWDTGIPTTSMVAHHVDRLVRDGRLIQDKTPGATRSLQLPGAIYIPPGPDTYWEIAGVKVDEARLYFIAYGGNGIEFLPTLGTALAYITTKVATYRDVPLKDMVRFIEFVEQKLESDGYVNSIQLHESGVLHDGQISENEGSRVREEDSN